MFFKICVPMHPLAVGVLKGLLGGYQEKIKLLTKCNLQTVSLFPATPCLPQMQLLRIL